MKAKESKVLMSDLVRCLLSVIAIAAAMSAHAASNNNWRKVDGVADGSMDTDGHWTLGAPTLDHYAYFPGSLGSYTVTIPAEYELTSNFRANVVNGETLTFNWRDCLFCQPQLPSDSTGIYYTEPFSFRYGGNHFFNFQFGASASASHHAISEISNAVIRLFAQDGNPQLWFDQGFYDFATPMNSAVWSPYVMFFTLGLGLKAQPRDYSSTVCIGECTTEFPSVYVQGNALTNTLRFSGGTHNVKDVQVPFASQVYTEHRTLTTVHVTDSADVTCSADMTFGAAHGTFGSTTNRLFELIVDDGGQLSLPGKSILQQSGGGLKVSVRDGGTLTTAGLTVRSQPSLTGKVEVVNATLNVTGTMSIGSVANATCRENSGFYAKNSTINFTGGGVANPDGADILVEDSTWNTMAGHKIAGSTNDTQMIFRRSDVNILASSTIGNPSSGYTLRVEDSDVKGTAAVNIEGATTIFTNSTVVMSNSVAIANVATGSGFPKVFFAGDGTYDQFGPLGVATVANAIGELVFLGGTNSIMGSLNIGQANNATGTVKIAGGTMKVFARPDRPTESSFIYLGTPEGGYGIFNIEGGSLIDSDSNGIQIGYKGSGEMNVSGGSVSALRIHLGTYALSSSVTNRFVQTGGLVDIPWYSDPYGITAAEKAGRTGLVRLDGGVMQCGRFYGGLGIGLFSANGGKIVTKGATANFFYGFAEAKIGAQGLEIESDYAVTAAQDFVDAEGEEGRLVLSGSGVKTLSGTGTELSRVEVVGGSAVLPAAARFGTVVAKNGAGVAFDGPVAAGTVGVLELGDANTVGVLTVKEGETLSFGSIVVSNAYVVLDGEFPSGGTSTEYPLVTCTGEMSAESKAAWTRAIAVGGITEGDVADFSWEEAGGVTTLKMNVRKPRTLMIELDGGVSNATENVFYSAGETLVADVAAGAQLTLSGVYERGAFQKTGAGKAILANTSNLFLDGVTLFGGILSVADTAALGLGDPLATQGLLLTNGTLEVTGPAKGASIARFGVASAPTNMLYSNNYYLGHDAVIVNNDVDLTAPVPTPATAAFIKRGSGCLTLTADAKINFPDTWGHTYFGLEAAGDTWTFPSDGSAPNVKYYALDVVEGEMKIKGTGPEPVEVDSYGSIQIGVPKRSPVAQPSLTLDNVKLVNKAGGSRFHVGPYMDETRSDVTEAMLTLTNAATLSADTVQVNFNGTRSGAKIRINADASDMIATYKIYPSRGTTPDVKYTFRNGARLLHNTCDIYSSVTFDFDNSIIAKNTSLTPVAIVSFGSSAVINYVFRNGSEFRCSGLTYNHYAAQGAAPGACRLTFDNSKWIPGTDNFSFDFPQFSNFSVVVENDGLVLEPPSGKTWSVAMPISGTGGMVVGGAGVVGLDGTKWAATGVAKVRAGSTLDLGGTTATGLVVGGPGTVSNGTISGGGIKIALANDGTVEGDVPMLSGVTSAGRFRVDVSREGASAPLSKPYVAAAVANYAGAAPDVSMWRIGNTGEIGLGARFEARDGKVYMTPKAVGFMITVQ